MSPITRRRVLGSVTGALAVLAGCNTDSRGDGTPTPTRSVREYERTVRAPDHYLLRHPAGEWPAWVGSNPGTVDEEEQFPLAGDQWLITDPSRATEISYAGVDGTEGAKAFVAETDVGAETLIVSNLAVRECERLEVCRVEWSREAYETRFTTRDRPEDVECREDTYDRVSAFIRVPDVISLTRGHQSGRLVGGCPGLENGDTTTPSGTVSPGPTRRNGTVRPETTADPSAPD